MQNKPIHSRIINFLIDTYKSLRFIYHHLREKRRLGDYYFPYRLQYNGESVNILANGPSLNVEIESLLKEGVDLSNSLVVNYFAFNDLFCTIKPRYYCVADPGFNMADFLIDKTRNTYLILNEIVSWPMTIFVWKDAVRMVSEFINNPYVKIVGLSTLRFDGFESKRYLFYKKGIAVPSYVNVTIMALYALLNLGYSTIYMYGVDHSFLAGLGVNNDNRLCMVDKHFYGTEKYELGYKYNGIAWTMKDFIYDKYLTFLEHEVMRGYADYLGARIINCTKDSWIDAYVRKSQIDKLEKQSA